MKKEALPEYFDKVDDEIWLVEDDRENMKLKYRVKEVISDAKTSFQHLNIVDLYDFGKSLVLDGVVQSTQMDGHIYNEMISHIPIVTHDNPEKVLVIGGGDCGAVNEIIKYDEPKSIDMVEIDSEVVKQCINHIPEISGEVEKDKRVNFIFDDGIKYVEKEENKKAYDVIIVDSSDPIGPAVELFTEKFYKNAKKCLKDDGIFVCQSESPFFYKKTMRNTYNLLKKLFPITRLYKGVIPSYPGGMWSFTFASGKYDPLNTDAARLSDNTKYINEDIFDACFKLPKFIKKYLDY